MKKNYFISAALLFGAAALISPVQADAQGGWRNMNHLIPNVSRAAGWSGVVTGGANGIGEIFAGAGLTYQVIRDLPAGEYTLSANAFYRDGAAADAAKRHFAGTETHDGFIFINKTEAAVPSLFDKKDVKLSDLFAGEDYVWGIVPNSLDEAATAIAEGNYAVSVKAQHPGGDMVIGYKCVGKPATLKANTKLVGGDETEAWSAFTNFKLTDASGKEIALAGDGKFDMKNDEDWWITNADGSNKGRGIQNGGVFSKTNASPYDHSVTLQNLPAGKYRFSIQSFNQHFLGAHSGYFMPMKDSWYIHEGKSAYDLYKEGAKEYVRGAVRGQTIPDARVEAEKLDAYLYAYEGEKFAMKDFWYEEQNDWFNGYTDADNNFVPGVKDSRKFAQEIKIKNLFDENLDEYPEVQNYKMADGSWKYQEKSGDPTWFESGHMREVAAFFLAHPDLYMNTINFDLTEPSTVTIGYHKDLNQNNYANPVFDFKLEYFDPNYSGYDVTGGSGVADLVVEDENAPVEYYNLQGIRVANPENGLYIVKQGNKVTKRIIK